ncbi:MAG: hypothetical protein DWI01_03730 [Planctomycetota bacterium]|nr:MAG: hypothetical protein DWI01_03730 [Planctomycetota bacterium]
MADSHHRRRERILRLGFRTGRLIKHHRRPGLGIGGRLAVTPRRRGHRESASLGGAGRSLAFPHRGDLRKHLFPGLFHLKDERFPSGMMLTGGQALEGLEPRLGRLEDDDRIGLSGSDTENPPWIGQISAVDPEPGPAGIESVRWGIGHGGRVRRKP